ncbi:MAG: EF-hand domain-containing protein [Pirellulales bacterium]
MSGSRSALAWSIRSICGVVLGAFLSVTGAATAAEPAAEFLRALRDADLYDLAIDYLDQMANSPLVAAQFKEAIPYERGVTLMEGARHQKDFSLREKQLDAAQVALDQFVKQFPNHAMAFSAKSELGNLLVERANLKMDRTKRPVEPQKDKLKTEARALYQQAYATFQALTADLKAKLAQLPKNIDAKKDPKRYEMREQMRADFLQAELLSAAVLEKSADTMDKASKEYKDTLTKAAGEYGEIYKNYRQRVAGLYARMYQGRCYQGLGNHKEALSYFDELLQNNEEPQDFHELRTKVLLMAVDSWMHDSQKKYGEVIAKAGQWVEKAYPNEMRSTEMHGLRLATARACKLLADQVKATKPKDPQVAQLLGDARKLAQFVARSPGDLQKDAQRLLAELGVQSATANDGKTDPKTFTEARQAGKDALDSVSVAKVNLESLPARIRDEKDANVKKELEEQLKQAQEALRTGNGEAHRMFQLALRLATSETSDDEVNSVRYYLCFIDYSLEEYFDAAVLGDFVAQRYPDSAGARQCAKIAMASYLKLYGTAKTDSKPQIDKLLGDFDKDKDGKLAQDEVKAMPEEEQARLAEADVDRNGKIEQGELVRLVTRFESEQIIGVCNYITSKWPDQPEAQEALGTLIAFMISENQLDKAQEMLSKIPEDAPQRGTAELKLGQAFWGAYLRGMHVTHEQEQAAAAAGAVDPATKQQIEARRSELKGLRDRAEKTLVDGVARMEKAGKVDATMASAVLSLAQVYVDTEQAQKAVELLEKANIGALKLVEQKHEAAARPGFAEDTYKAALRAYISSLAAAKGEAAGELIKKADAVMNQLNEVVAGAPDGSKRLFTIYYSLARDLEQQMELAAPDTKKNLALGFETFLNQVRKTASDLNVLYWVATTFYSMGESYAAGPNNQISADAKRYFGEAAKTYQDILARGKSGQLQLEGQLASQINLQLAKTHRAMGEYEVAIKLFMEILTKSPTLISIQTEAAKTYEEWAERAGDPKYYLHAIQGSMENRAKKSLIWGWAEIAKIVSGKPQFREIFYEARYHVALARYKYGMHPKNAADKKKHLDAAELALSKTVQLYPNLDGDAAANQKSFRTQYDTLAKLLQKGLGKAEKGLAAYEQAAAPAPATGPATVRPGTAAAVPAGGAPKK